MSTATTSTTTSAPKRRTRAARPTRPTGPNALGGSAQARRHAAMILEALNGVRTTQEAADAMGVALPRYYVLETRALEGFIEALEPRRRGRQVTVEREQEKLREEIARLERETRRYQALYRTAQRSLGLPAAPKESGAAKKPKKAKAGSTEKTRRRRRKSRGEAILSGLQKAEASPSPSTDSAASSAQEGDAS